jgi:subfamily B ATP-binding cassette protein MsbA
MRSFLRVVWSARRHGWWLVLAIVSMVMVAAATVFAYNLVRPIYDELLGPAAAAPAGLDSLGGLVGWLDRLTVALRAQLSRILPSSRTVVLALVVLAIAIKAGATFIGRYAVARFGLTTVRELRDRLFDALMGQSLAWFRDHTTPSLVSRVVSDVQLIREALAERFGDVLQDVLTVALLFAYAWSLEPVLALVTTVVAPLVLAPVIALSRRLRRRSHEMQQRMGELASVLDESVRGLAVVQAFGAEAAVARRFRRATWRQLGAELRARAVQAVNAPLMEVIGAVAAVALVGWASVRIAAGSLTLGDFSAFLVAVYGTYNPLKRLNKFNLAVQQADVAAGRVFEVLDAPIMVADRTNAGELEGLGEGVRLEGVFFAYEDGRWVLEDVDLEVPTGGTVALVGPSGGGKTTIARLIPRFYDAQCGAVTINGRDIRDVTRASLRARIGLVTQEPLLFDVSVAENIALGRPDTPQREIEAAAQAAHAHGFICDLPHGYDTRLGEAGIRLSGGQRQRLAIARAVLHDPDLLILDEATASLDAESERLIQAALEQLMAERTTLVIAHRLATVRRADRIVVVDAGRVVELGTHAELVARRGLYYRLVEAQALS